MEYTLTVTVNLYHLIIACLILALFGIGYNSWVGRLKRKGHDHGFMSMIVVLGCAVTGLTFGLATSAWLILPLGLCFLASGIPMAIGSFLRYIAQRDQAADERDAVACRRLGE